MRSAREELQMIKVTLAGDGSVREIEENSSVRDAAKSIQPQSCKKGSGSRKGKRNRTGNGLSSDRRLHSGNSEVFRRGGCKDLPPYGFPYMLAQAVKKLYPDAKLAIGPATSTTDFIMISTAKHRSSTDQDFPAYRKRDEKNRRGGS